MNRIRGLITQTGGEQRVFSSMFFRWIDILAHGDIDVGHDFALNLSDIANQEPTGLHQMLLHRMVGTTHMLRGEFDNALWHLDRFISNYRADIHADLMRPFGATGQPRYRDVLFFSHSRNYRHARRGEPRH